MVPMIDAMITPAAAHMKSPAGGGAVGLDLLYGSLGTRGWRRRGMETGARVDSWLSNLANRPMGETDGASIIVRIETTNPISLTDFVEGFLGVGSQFEKYTARAEQGIAAEFYVQEVRAGSIIVELLPVLTDPATGPLFKEALDNIARGKLVVDFLSNLKERLSKYLTGGRDAEASKSDLRDFHRTLHGIATDPKGSVELVAAEYRDGERDITSRFIFRTPEARRGLEAIQEHQLELAAATGEDRQRALLKFIRPSLELARMHKRSGEKAIVERLSPKALAVIYASDLARERIQHEMQDGDANIFRLLFDVDLSVELSNGKPAAYRIMAVHQVIDPED
jgi:hypothetical protein